MARDPRKSSAFDSGMRGREKPKVQSGNGRGESGTQGPKAGGGGENVQKPGTQIGDSKGVGLDAYTSGMRGPEKPKQKSADAATMTTGDNVAAGNLSGSKQQGPNSVVGKPEGEGSAETTSITGKRTGVGDSQLQNSTSSAYKVGIPGNNTEAAAAGMEPSAEEDDTHINVRIPKASLKRKAGGVQGQ